MNNIKRTYIVFCIIIVLVITNILSHYTIKDMENIMDKQQQDYDAFVSTLQESYGELQNDYIELMENNERLESRLQEKKCKYTEDEVYLLAQCVEAEAGYNSESQKYVTQVILNRVNSARYPDTIREVIYQKTGRGVAQFSVAYNGSMEGREVKSKTLANVYNVLLFGTDLPEYVQYFYSVKVTNNWVNTLNTHTTVGGTVFAYASKEVF